MARAPRRSKHLRWSIDSEGRAVAVALPGEHTMRSASEGSGRGWLVAFVIVVALNAAVARADVDLTGD
jgi:hypothetical protein